MNDQVKLAIKKIGRVELEMATDCNLRHLFFEDVDFMTLPPVAVYCVVDDKLVAMQPSELAFFAWFESSFESGYDADELYSGNYYLHIPTNRVIALEHKLFNEFCIASFVDKGVFDIVAMVKKHKLRGLNTPMLRQLKIAELI